MKINHLMILILMIFKFNYVKKEDFENWLKSKNKLGGQHKIPRLQNDRLLIQELLERNQKSTRNH